MCVQVYIHMRMWMGSLPLLSACILDRTGQGAPGTHLSPSAGIVSRCHQMWILCVLGIEFRSSGLHSKLLTDVSFSSAILSGLFISGTSVFWGISNHLSSWVLCLLCLYLFLDLTLSSQEIM